MAGRHSPLTPPITTIGVTPPTLDYGKEEKREKGRDRDIRHSFVTTGLCDSQVQYYQPAKWRKKRKRKKKRRGGRGKGKGEGIGGKSGVSALSHIAMQRLPFFTSLVFKGGKKRKRGEKKREKKRRRDAADS